MTAPQPPDFRSLAFLHAHVRQTMAFYEPVATDAGGGMYHFFLDDGTVYDERTRHLVSATRFVNFFPFISSSSSAFGSSTSAMIIILPSFYLT